MAKSPPITQKARITRAWLRTRPDHKYSASYDQFYIDLAGEFADTKTGTWKYWDWDGKLIREEEYENGQSISKREFK